VGKISVYFLFSMEFLEISYRNLYLAEVIMLIAVKELSEVHGISKNYKVQILN
jgi:hypothetical protein